MSIQVWRGMSGDRLYRATQILLGKGFCAIDYALIIKMMMIVVEVAVCSLVFNALHRSNNVVFACNYIAILTSL
jgi:hypothetical protein